MKTITATLVIITLLFLGFTWSGAPQQEESAPDQLIEEEKFEVKRGVNISHWLSQSGRRGEERAAFFLNEDVKFIADQGYDHIRIPIDEEQMWDEFGQKEAETFALLHQGIQWAHELGLRVVVDLHILRSHHFNESEKPLWTDPDAQEVFFQCWRDLSGELKKYPNHLVAYELMNEPVADDPEEWNILVNKCYQVVRKTEPERTIVIGSNLWQSVHTFKDLKVPEDDPNILLSFHFYIPHIITHYQANWTHIKDYHGPINYPGLTVTDKDLEGLTGDLLERLKVQQKVYTIDSLNQLMQLPLKVAEKYGLPLYCGEWGCYSQTPDHIRWQWYKDVRTCLEKNNIAWANWDYKGGFGIVDQERNPNREMLQSLFK
ncbi:MAG: glycoside hydrolase family 5 protein [Cyclobacteriaceae bacterium]